MAVNVTQKDETLMTVIREIDRLTDLKTDEHGNIETGYDEGYVDALDRIWAYCRSQLTPETRKQLDQTEENQ